MKSIPSLLKQAQIVFNRWIRNRDSEKGCITCNGQAEHAGHYLPMGHYNALRFNEINVNGQCAICNLVKKGNEKIYRVRLIELYGIEAIEEMENLSRATGKWDRQELQELINKYKS